MPAPESPTTRFPLLVHFDPVPVTVTSPSEPLAEPSVPFSFVTAAPFSTISMPIPATPTTRLPELVHVDPLPVTVAVPSAPAIEPIAAFSFVTTPPFLDDQRAHAVDTEAKVARVGPR